MNKGIWLIFGIFIILALSQNASALTYIDSCQTLSMENETYMLNDSITQNSGLQCILIQANNITLDGAGYSMFENISGGRLIEAQNSRYITIRNITADCKGKGGNSRGISLANVNNSLVEYANVINCTEGNGAIRLDRINGGIFRDINATYSTSGMVVLSAGSGNLIFQNVNVSYNTGAGLVFSSGNKYNNVSIVDSTFIRNINRGILFWNMTNSQITNSYFDTNSGTDCISVQYSENTTMTNNNLQQCHLDVSSGSNNTVFRNGIINITKVQGLNTIELTNTTTFIATDSLFNNMNCSAQINAFSTVGNINNTYLQNNTWYACGGTFFHSENTGLVYNTSIMNERIYIYNYTGQSAFLSAMWWTNANVTNFWNNYIETHLPDYPIAPYDSLYIKSDNADVRNITYVFYGMPATALRFDSSNSSQRKQNIYIENVSMTCMTAGCMNNTPTNVGMTIFNANGVIVKNFNYASGGATALSVTTNSSNIYIENVHATSRFLAISTFLNNNLTVVNSSFIITSPLSTGCSITSFNANLTNVICNSSELYGIIVSNLTAGGLGVVNIYDSIIIGNLSGIDARNNMIVNAYNTIVTRTYVGNSSVITLLNQSQLGSIRSRNIAVVNCYNCTMNDAENTSAIDSSQVNVYYNLNVLNPLNANANLYDLQNILLSSFTGNNTLWVRQFFQNASGRTITTPNSIQLSKSGYYAKADSINMNINKDYTISMRLIVPIIDPNSITGQLVLTLGFGIMGLFAVLTLLGFGYLESTGKPDPEIIAKIMIGVVIIILAIVAVWTGIVIPP